MYRFIVALVACVLLANTSLAEQLVINLATAQREPIIEVVSPPGGSADRISFTSAGMLIEQHADIPDRPTGVAGFKMLLACGGDFRASLDFRIDQLTAPTSGWGQGLIFTLNLDDPKQTQIKLNQIVFQGGETTLTSVDHMAQGTPPKYQVFSDRVQQEGSLVIERQGSTAIFSIQDKAGLREVYRIDHCPKHNLRGIEVWSTRQDSGNTPAKMLLKRLTIDAGSFKSYLERQPSFWTWQRVFVAGNILVVLALLTVVVHRRRAGHKSSSDVSN